MSSQSNQSKSSLNKISNYILSEQNIDIKAYTTGHLNENHLWKPPEQRAHQPWVTAKLLKKSDSLKDDESRLHEKISVPQNSKFSLYASVKSTNYSEKNDNRKSTEDIRLPSIFSSTYRSPRTTAFSTKDFQLPITDKEMALNFLQSPFKGTTKEEKFRNLEEFEKKVLQKDDLLVKNILHSNSVVTNLERTLNEELIKLENQNLTKDQKFLYRLDIHNSIFTELIENSKCFGEVLSRIKFEYDEYLFNLISNQNSSLNALEENDEFEESKINIEKNEIREIEMQIRILEENIKNANKVNTELKQKIEAETRNLEEAINDKKLEESAEIEENKRLEYANLKSNNLEDKIIKIKNEIIEKLEAMNKLDQKLKNEFVPHIVIYNLNQSIKDVEIESNKLSEQNKYFKSREQEAEKECRSILLKYDQTEFAEENVDRLLKLMQNIDFLKPNSFKLNENYNIDVNGEIFSNSEQASFHHNYDDYFS